MDFPHIASKRPMSRRHFLRGAGAVLSLPLLEAMLPTFGRAQSTPGTPGDGKPRRMFAVLQNLGFIAPNFFPTGAGRDYVASPYLELIQGHRSDFTVFTGVSLPDVDGGHPTDVAWLTGAPHPARGGFRNTISLDQVVARHIGHLSRFASITLAVNTRNRSLSCSEIGVAIPPEDRASEVYKLLFVQGSKAEVDAQVLKLETGQSILDTIAQQSRQLQRDLSPPDRAVMDQYYTGVRDLEMRLHASREWEKKPKPTVNMPPPVDPRPSQYFEKITLMYDLATLAFQTDSSRAITLFISSVGTPPVEGIFDVPITDGYLSLAQHGNSPAKLAQLRALDVQHFKRLNALLAGLKAINEEGETLLDRTQVLWGSNFNDVNANAPRRPIPEVQSLPAPRSSTNVDAIAPTNQVFAPATASAASSSKESTTNLPIVLAGGGWKHGQHLVFDTTRNYPLTNLHLSMLHRMGIPEKKFSSSTEPFRGLEMS
jgi:hypothetical protein